jgi:hypothetical protein
VSCGLWKSSCEKSRRPFGEATVAFEKKCWMDPHVIYTHISHYFPLSLTSGPCSSVSSSRTAVGEGHLQVRMKVVWIISTSDPIRIQIMQVRRRVFKIHANVDNPNPIVCRCGLDMMLVISDGSGLSDN